MVMMSFSKMTAGSGWDYLIRNTVNADRDRSSVEKLTEYFLGSGVPAGVWMNMGADTQSVSGAVSQTQMAALFGNGWDPNAQQVIVGQLAGVGSHGARMAAARRALKQVQLGRAMAGCQRSPEQLVAMIEAGTHVAQLRVGRVLDGVEMRTVVAQAARKFIEQVPTDAEGRADAGGGRDAVTGYQMTFSPAKSVSVAWALGDERVVGAIEAAHEQALTSALGFMRDQAVFSRQGVDGAATIDVTSLWAQRFRHWTNRDDEPDIHDHVTIANRVMCSDGRWRTLDGRFLHKWAVAASELYNRQLADNLRRSGFETRVRDMGEGKQPVIELADVSDQDIARFSTRRAHIQTDTARRREEFRAVHGRWPTRNEEFRLSQEAAYSTRKPKSGRPDLVALRGGWAATDGGRVGLVRMHDGPLPGAETIDVDEAIGEVVEQLESSRSVWEDHHVSAAVNRWCSAQNVTVPDAIRDAISSGLVTDDRIVAISPAHVEALGGFSGRADGVSVYVRPHDVMWTSRETLDREERLVDAALAAFPSKVMAADVKAAVAASAVSLGVDQQDFVEHLVRDHGLTVGIGPAGTGKTTALAVLADAAHRSGVSVQAVALARRTATALGEEIAADRTFSVAAWLHDRQGPEALSPGDIVIVDEAGVVSTADLDKIVSAANDAGAQVVAVGDDRQLTAVGAGGGLQLVARQAGAARLEQVHRFLDPGEAEASIRFHDHADVSWYTAHGRVHGGTVEAMTHQMVTAWTSDVMAGRSAVMIAATNQHAAELNQAAQAILIKQGAVAASGPTTTAQYGDRTVELHVGDQVITRLGDTRLIASDRKTRVQNGDRWTVTRINTDGSVRAVNDRRKSVDLPAAYVGAHVQLGYAVTGYMAQGLTVDRGYWITDARADSNLAYPSMTRGRQDNQVFITGVGDDDEAGTVLEQIASRTSGNRSATQEMIELWSVTDQPADLIRAMATELSTANAARYAQVLTDDGRHISRAGRKDVWNSLRAGESAGISPAQLVAAARTDLDALARTTTSTRPLDAAAVAAILDDHLSRVAVPPSDRPLADMATPALDKALERAQADMAAARSGLADAREAARLVPHPVTLPDSTTIPSWAERDLGHLSDTALADRQTDTAATLAAANRDLFTARWRTAAADATLTRLNTPGRRLDPEVQAAAQAATTAHAALDAAGVRVREATREAARVAAETERRTAMTDTQRELEADSRGTVTNPANPILVVGHRQQTMRTLDAATEAERNAATIADRLLEEARLRAHTPDMPAGSRPLFDHPTATTAGLPAERAANLAALQAAITDRISQRGHTIAEQRPAWAENALGPLPDPKDPLRGAWEYQAARIDTWRQLTGHTDPQTPLPPITEAAPAVERWTDPARDLADLRSRATDIKQQAGLVAFRARVAAEIGEKLPAPEAASEALEPAEHRTVERSGGRSSRTPGRTTRRDMDRLRERQREDARRSSRRDNDEDRERGRGRGRHL
ncbi:hypothetical protein EFN30_10915 [Propionibacterium freudenreichii]|nr:hypothetical protein [Propionibacterium freudenreichii]